MSDYCFGGYQLLTGQRRLLRDGQELALGGRAFDLLLALVERRERVASTRELAELVWPHLVVEENNLRQQVANLRKILGAQAILTIPGRGYRLALPVEAVDDMPANAGTTEPDVAARSHPVIAVLPFADLSSDPAQAYFSDAITQDIITSLSKHRWLTVVARNTVFGYKNMTRDIREIARELGAHYLVEGSVQRAATRVRVITELVDAARNATVWAESYERDIEDVFAVQDDIVHKLVGRLEPEIGFAERQKVVQARRADLRAWDCFHLGVAHFFRFTAADNREALRLLQRSRELDALFGEAHAWWGYAALLDMVYWDSQPSQAGLDAALAAAQLALEQDDRNAVFYAIKARIQLARRKYENAIIENEMAISLNPTLASAYCGLGDSLAYQGHYERALPYFQRALELSPRDPQRWAFLTYGALALIFRGDYERALEWTDRAWESPNCQYWTIAHRAVALALLGRHEQARLAAATLLRMNPLFSLRYARDKLFYLHLPQQMQLYLDGLGRAGVPERAAVIETRS